MVRRSQAGLTLVELLVVVAVLATLASAGMFAATRVRSHSLRQACRAERSVIRVALEATRTQNPRDEYPGVEGPDGLDAVRAAGFLEWDPASRWWRYASPAGPDGVESSHLVRTHVDHVSPVDCPA